MALKRDIDRRFCYENAIFAISLEHLVQEFFFTVEEGNGQAGYLSFTDKLRTLVTIFSSCISLQLFYCSSDSSLNFLPFYLSVCLTLTLSSIFLLFFFKSLLLKLTTMFLFILFYLLGLFSVNHSIHLCIIITTFNDNYDRY